MVCTYSGPPIFGWPEPGHLSDRKEGDDDAHVDSVLLVYIDDNDSNDEDVIDEADALVADRPMRQVHVPKLKFQCRRYPKMLDRNKELKPEPPLISRLSDDEVTRILDTPLEVPNWCNHTQAVEGAIKAVTESCTAVTGAKERNSYIRQRTRSLKFMPKFNTKDYYCSI